jgi:Short-chain alcohol dehydrogenase of unknown specificity
MREFRGKHALVTGAASGIGKALVLELLGMGARVLATDISDAGLAAIAHEAQSLPGDLFVRPGDVSDEESVGALKGYADETLGHVELLFNNAGVAYNARPTWQAPASAVEWMYGVNVFGVLNGIRAFVPGMIDRGSGHIVNTASIGGFQVSTRTDIWYQGLYASTKYAVVAISEALAIELAPYGIGVSVLAPSAVRTGIARSGAHRPDRFGSATERVSPEAMAEMIDKEGAPPEMVARIALRGVRDKRFYLFTDTNLRERIRARAREIDEAFEVIPDEQMTVP